ncbi:glycosyltransferase [Peribacillus cavernae]|uniref:Glycosyltransferase n=1 Tax=Peribacillus cavernae TaxID=1674310 RepID=A0A3S0VG53_9BACI|nr:glycosyltransferase family 4 protein [Peribacillus cavernae]MDQ0218435.1 glycosyltransferase involved in cell wall biosynthesis [Peribacillus cavernae]RUQ31437.1 glycosyltransferase [Peribacillus cavernae]
MKICHITSVHSANDTRIFIKESQSLSKAGHDVYYVVPNTEETVRNDIKILNVISDINGQLDRMRNTTKKVYQKALEVDADVYHFHDPELIPIGLKLKSHGKKVIYDVHEDVPEQILSKEWIPKPMRKTISKAIKRYEKYASGKFDAIVAATPHIANRFQTYNQRTVTLHNYPLLDELAADSSHVSDSSKNNSIYIGGIYILRGIKEMVQSVEKVNEDFDCKLTLAGEFAPKSLEAEVRGMSGFKFTDYLGFLDRKQVKKILSEANMGLVLLHPEPRFTVSMPIKMFEYMSAGLPVIASNFPLWKEIIEQNQCGLCVDPLNIGEISEAIKWILSNPEEARIMGENGRNAVTSIYNWENESEKLIQLYQSL